MTCVLSMSRLSAPHLHSHFSSQSYSLTQPDMMRGASAPMKTMMAAQVYGSNMSTSTSSTTQQYDPTATATPRQLSPEPQPQAAIIVAAEVAQPTSTQHHRLRRRSFSSSNTIVHRKISVRSCPASAAAAAAQATPAIVAVSVASANDSHPPHHATRLQRNLMRRTHPSLLARRRCDATGRRFSAENVTASEWTEYSSSTVSQNGLARPNMCRAATAAPGLFSMGMKLSAALPPFPSLSDDEGDEDEEMMLPVPVTSAPNRAQSEDVHDRNGTSPVSCGSGKFYCSFTGKTIGEASLISPSKSNTKNTVSATSNEMVDSQLFDSMAMPSMDTLLPPTLPIVSSPVYLGSRGESLLSLPGAQEWLNLHSFTNPQSQSLTPPPQSLPYESNNENSNWMV